MYFSNRISKIFYVYWIITVCNNGLQWGIKPAESVEYPYIWAFPVSFASKNIGVFVTNNDISVNSGAIGVYDVLTESAKIALYGNDNNNAAFLFAIGQQQYNTHLEGHRCVKHWYQVAKLFLYLIYLLPCL